MYTNVIFKEYKQQYGTKAFEGPEHKNQRHIAYRQLFRWCWGVLWKEIRVVLPACAVSCIRAHFPPPDEEDEHAAHPLLLKPSSLQSSTIYTNCVKPRIVCYAGIRCLRFLNFLKFPGSKRIPLPCPSFDSFRMYT